MTQLDDRIRRGLEAQLRELGRRTANGERRVGWKVGLNDPRVQQALRIARPVIGFLASGTQVAHDQGHSLAGATHPAVEPEIAVHVGEGGVVAGLGPALEVIDVDLPFDDLERVMAGNVFHRAFVLGPTADGVSALGGVTASFLRDGEEQHAIDVDDAAMEPAAVLELVDGYLSALGESLQAGDVVIAGSLVTALPAAPGERFELRVDGMEPVSLGLEPA